MVTPITARAHAFVADLAAPELSTADRHHLARVLRLPVGAELTVSDGHGGWRPCRLRDGLALAPAGEAVVEPVPAPALTVACALAKGERPELVVQKLTELGIDRIAPFVAGRSVVRWDAAKADRRAARWAQIAREAAMQCRRTRLPEIAPLGRFADVAARDGAVMAEAGGEVPSLARPTVLVGPEGGWSPDERDAGLPTVALGAHVLRAETAAITAGAIFAALRSCLVASS